MLWRARIFFCSSIVREVAATITLKLAAGFTRIVPTIVVVAGYSLTFFFSSSSSSSSSPAASRSEWCTATGRPPVSRWWRDLPGRKLTAVQVVGLALVAIGVLAIEFGAAH